MFFVINSIYVIFFPFFSKFYELTGLFIQRFKYLMLSGLQKEEEKKMKEGESRVGEKEGALLPWHQGAGEPCKTKVKRKGERWRCEK